MRPVGGEVKPLRIRKNYGVTSRHDPIFRASHETREAEGPEQVSHRSGCPKSNEGQRCRRPSLRPDPNPAPVRAWARPGRGSGRGLSAPVGPLGSFRSVLRRSSGSLTANSSRHCCFDDFTIRSISPPKHRHDPFAPLGPKASGSQGIRGKWVRLVASRFFLKSPSNASPGFHPCGYPPQSAVAAVWSVRPFPAGHSVTARLQADSGLRVAPSGILRVLPVNNGDIVDKCDRLRRS